MRLSVLGLFLFGASTAFAQIGPQAPQAAYEGQNVSAVSLIANPHRNLQPLISVVTQKADTPYSQEKISASAQALKQAGSFPKVEVRVVPELTGLHVNFLLEPAYYLGIVEFPGIAKYFSYTRLLQVANVSDEDPYDPARIPLAETALLTFLRKNGYFQATVHAEVAIDDAHQLVSVSFGGEAGKQAKISSVSIEGPDTAEAERLIHNLKSLRARLSGGLLKPGKAYGPARISQATALLKRALTKQSRLAASIHEKPPAYDATANRVAVSFQVNVGPLVTVRLKGAKLSAIPFLAGRQIKKLIPI